MMEKFPLPCGGVFLRRRGKWVCVPIRHVYKAKCAKISDVKVQSWDVSPIFEEKGGLRRTRPEAVPEKVGARPVSESFFRKIVVYSGKVGRIVV